MHYVKLTNTLYNPVVFLKYSFKHIPIDLKKKNRYFYSISLALKIFLIFRIAMVWNILRLLLLVFKVSFIFGYFEIHIKNFLYDFYKVINHISFKIWENFWKKILFKGSFVVYVFVVLCSIRTENVMSKWTF